MGVTGPTDVLSFPLDPPTDQRRASRRRHTRAARRRRRVPGDRRGRGARPRRHRRRRAGAARGARHPPRARPRPRRTGRDGRDARARARPAAEHHWHGPVPAAQCPTSGAGASRDGRRLDHDRHVHVAGDRAAVVRADVLRRRRDVAEPDLTREGAGDRRLVGKARRRGRCSDSSVIRSGSSTRSS